MTQYQGVAEQIQGLLGLATPPVAVAFVSEAPSGITQTTTVSPSTCGFWRQAEQGVFYAEASQHFNCQVGAMVMGFNLPDEVMQQIGGLVNTMCGCAYLSPEEGDKIPSVGRGSAGVVYGPLSQFPVTPDAIVMWLSPKQAMLFNEASGAASWAAAPSRVNGRPACGALPLAIQGSAPTLSLGCIGMRTFTDVADDRLLAVVPGDKAAEFAESLAGTASANNAMLSFYQQRKAEVLGAV
jgi:uncharacterized protein (DUF169 family)